MEIVTKDSNGNVLNGGDTVIMTKTLKVKGSQINLKRGDKVKNIKLIDDEANIEARIGKATIVIKTEFIKKA